MENLINLYIVTMSIILFIMMYVDKSRAKNQQYRISEKSLWTVALLGGAFGGVIGMYLFRHKTKHISFTIGFPLLAIIQIYMIISIF